MSEPWTPGPWKVRQHPGPDGLLLVTAAKEPDRATYHANVGWVTRENAPIVAAAPEMAELLEIAATAGERSGNEVLAAMDRARALLDRIRGAESGDPGPIGTVRTVSP